MPPLILVFLAQSILSLAIDQLNVQLALMDLSLMQDPALAFSAPLVISLILLLNLVSLAQMELSLTKEPLNVLLALTDSPLSMDPVFAFLAQLVHS